MSATAPFKAQAANQGSNWLFTDPYTYQYSFVSSHTAESPRCELEGSNPSIRLSHPDNYVTNNAPVELDAGHDLVPYSKTPNNSLLKKSSLLTRNRFSTARASLKHTHVRQNLPRYSDLPETVPAAKPATRPNSLGFIPIKKTTPPAPPPPQYTGIISPDASGLIPANEHDHTPNTPGTDFDAILKNIGPISKKRRYCGPSRASRYYDRYEKGAG
ncbi:hypothetical protein F4810DRAFT_678136 [Camillea tinctor]|nr:hypothetical protein F4810DRAFT_678136 [Camillea tinctor]